MTQVKEYHINNAAIRVIFGNILNSTAEVIADSIEYDFGNVDR